MEGISLHPNDQTNEKSKREIVCQQLREMFSLVEKTLIEECFDTPRVRDAKVELFSACGSVIRAVQKDFVDLPPGAGPSLN